MAKLAVLASSSSGNCYFVGTSDCGVLIDAGISCKQILLRLSALGISESAVKAVFVTHEHDDHVKGLRVLADKLGVPVYATGGTLSALANSGKAPQRSDCVILPRDDSVTRVGSLTVGHFATYHDAKESCGYVITVGESRVAVATDTGVMDGDIYSVLTGCDLTVIESNYDEDMLRTGPYDPGLKNRILSREGHLSNEDCARTVFSLVSQGHCRRFILGHISPHNNTPSLAFASTDSLLKHGGFVRGEDYTLEVAPADGMEKIIRF